LIIVDDCSEDNTLQLARIYEAKDKRVKVFANHKNLGDYANRNKAASYATGKYLKYLDADDIIYPHGLGLMVSAMLEFPEAAYGFSYFGAQKNEFKFPKLYAPADAFEEHFMGSSFFYAGPGGSIIKREVFERLTGFSGRRYIGDTEIWFKMSMKYPCILFWPGLIWWRVHDAQENKFEKADIKSVVSRNDLVIEILNHPECPLTGDQKAIAKNNCYTMYVRRIYANLLGGEFSNAWYLFKNFNLPYHYFLSALFPINRMKAYFKIINSNK
jgi:glycosyltransferase involved in cell wall biosynthesis